MRVQIHLPHTLPLAFFDARVNNYPKEEVCNYYIWRQQDILRNSIQGLGQYHLGQRTIHGLKNQEVIELLQERKNINVDDIPLRFRRGIGYTVNGYLYHDLPVFTEDREFIDRHVYLKEENNNE
jgi:tRNA(His) 5'-end guanylyltransferase